MTSHFYPEKYNSLNHPCYLPIFSHLQPSCSGLLGEDQRTTNSDAHTHFSFAANSVHDFFSISGNSFSFSLPAPGSSRCLSSFNALSGFCLPSCLSLPLSPDYSHRPTSPWILGLTASLASTDRLRIGKRSS